MYALFVDFRAAFDKLDTEKIFECVRQTDTHTQRERERGRNKLKAGTEH
jgi:hypothetical protein